MHPGNDYAEKERQLLTRLAKRLSPDDVDEGLGLFKAGSTPSEGYSRSAIPSERQTNDWTKVKTQRGGKLGYTLRCLIC